MDGTNGPSLREYVETRFNLLVEQIKNMGNRFDEKIREADVRYEQRFNGQMEATGKADEASEKRFESVNEFRKTLTDQTLTFIPRTEATQQIMSLDSRLTKLESSVAEFLSRNAGTQQSRIDLRSDYGMWVSGIMMFISIVALIISFLRR